MFRHPTPRPRESAGRRRPRRLAVAALAASIGGAVVAGTPAPAAAAVTCHRWASATGNDNADGLVATPVLTLSRLAALLQAGETGCITNGSTIRDRLAPTAGGYGIINASGQPGLPITIRSEPGGSAAFSGLLLVNGSDIVFESMRFLGTPDNAQATHIRINGQRVTFRDNDITNPQGICMSVGELDGYRPTWPGFEAQATLIERNRIHHCGTSPALVWTDKSSGAHGIYIMQGTGTIVRENIIDHGLYRGLQVYPSSNGVTIESNLFYRNATHVNLGRGTSEGGNLPPPPDTWYPRNVTIRRNIMAMRWTTGGPTGDPLWTRKNESAIFGFFPAGSPTFGNVAGDNCIDPASAPATAGNGIQFGTVVTGTPQFVNVAAGDYRLVAGSPCTGYGPTHLQPGGGGGGGGDQPVVLVPGARTVLAATGKVDTYAYAVSNRGTVGTAASVTIKVAATTGIVADARVTASGATCTTASGLTTCTLGTLAAGTSKTVTVRIAAAAPGAYRLEVAAGVTGATPGAPDVRSATVIGTRCTKAGTLAADALSGTSGPDVICGFDGNDVIQPLAGDDIVWAGAGADTVSYTTLSGPVVVNLLQKSAWDAAGGTAVGYDQFDAVEHVTGGLGNDQLLGDHAVNTIIGGAGIDVMYGYGGADLLQGGAGNDELYGGDGNDRLDGGSGTDRCAQNAGTGTLAGCEL